MHRIAKPFCAALIAATALTPLAARAGNFYVFGDSLVDNGNIPKLIGVNYPPPPYYMNHFSNGPVWAEYFPELTGLGFKPSNDYGVGGAFAGPVSVLGTTINNLENLPEPVGAGFTTPLPSFLQEVQTFRATGTRFGSSDVVGVWVGANDYFAALALVEFGLANASTEIPFAVNLVATQTAQGVDELSALGARRFVVFTLPNLGLTPLFNKDSAAAIAQANEISQLHGQALVSAMAGVHAQTGDNIILINQQQLFTELLANPALYGKTNTTDACIDTPSCVSASTAAQNSYVFWDTVHPTTGTHLLIAEYAAAALNGVADLAAPAQIAAFGAAAFSDELGARLEGLRTGAEGFAINLPNQGMVAQLGADDANAVAPVGTLSGFLSGNYDYGSRDTAGADNGFSYSAGTVALGLDDRVAENVVVGAAFGYGDDSGTAEGGEKISANAYQLGVYGTFYQPNYYLNTKFAYGIDTYNNYRAGIVAGRITAKPAGHTYDFGGELGYLLHCGQLTYGPLAGLDVADAQIGNYTETGDAALTQSVSAQDFNRFILDAGGQISTTLPFGNAVLQPHLRATIDDLVSGNGGNFSSEFTDEPLVALTNVYPKSTKYWGVIGGGVTAALSERLSVNADFATTVAKSDGENHEVSADLRYRF
jgi:outer membrane lipase/esterase